MLDDLGLLATLRWLAGEIQERSAIETELTVEGTERRLPPNVEMMLFRIVQEALRNVEKHSNASKAEIVVRFEDEKTVAMVKDNGIGFDFSETIGGASRSGKLGLVGMQERARLLGGRLEIDSGLAQGTTVTIEAPV